MRSTDPVGSAGGHATMAGAQVPLGILQEVSESESLEDVVEAFVAGRFFEALDDDAPRRRQARYRFFSRVTAARHRLPAFRYPGLQFFWCPGPQPLAVPPAAPEGATYILRDGEPVAMTDDVVEHRRLIIAGTGIAGLTAAIYAARSNNDPLLVEGDEPGGQLTLTTDVENYPGFPEGISGPELINNMKARRRRSSAPRLETESSWTSRKSPQATSASNSPTATCTPPTRSSPPRVPAPAPSASPARTS